MPISRVAQLVPFDYLYIAREIASVTVHVLSQSEVLGLLLPLFLRQS